jgi:hypothetical protein
MRLKLTRGNALKLKVSTRIPAQIIGGTGITVTRDNGSYTIDAELTEIADALGSTVLNRANHTGTQLAATISDLSEAVDDRVSALLVAGTNVSLSYDDTANTLTITSSAGGASINVFRYQNFI